jgi:hypothetical protein
MQITLSIQTRDRVVINVGTERQPTYWLGTVAGPTSKGVRNWMILLDNGEEYFITPTEHWRVKPAKPNLPDRTTPIPPANVDRWLLIDPMQELANQIKQRRQQELNQPKVVKPVTEDTPYVPLNPGPTRIPDDEENRWRKSGIDGGWYKDGPNGTIIRRPSWRPKARSFRK